MRAWALLLAAGEGTRLAEATGGTPKQFIEWKGLPLYWHSALLFKRCARIAGLVFVFPSQVLEAERERIAALNREQPLGLPWIAVSGGSLRQDSVHLGLDALPREHEDPAAAAVLVHDTARCFATPRLVNRVLDALEDGAVAAIPGLPVIDTIKTVKDGLVCDTLDRSALVAVQTPQAFRTGCLVAAHKQAESEGWSVTDDAALLERCGQSVRVVEGEAANSKITRPEDLVMLQERHLSLPRTALGYDVHRYVSPESPTARPLRLGGVLIPGPIHVQAHSDGDVLLHALADALLGCCAGGDIGQLFPDNDPACEGLHSAVILDEALQRVLRAGLTLCHVDLTIVAQKPKIAPHREAIRANVARLLGLDPDQVGLKATTEEGLGFTGAGEGLKAVAVVTVVPSAPRPAGG